MPSDRERLSAIAIAGLLHDIGKPFEAARLPFQTNAPRLENQMCPTGNDGRGTHRHVLWTAEVLHRIENRSDFGVPFASFYGPACYHHRPRPDSLEDHILQTADWWASGHDRREQEEASNTPWAGLLPILGQLGEAHQGLSASAPVLRPCPLGTEPSRFFAQPNRSIDEYRADAAALLEPLVQALSFEDRDPFRAVRRIEAISGRLLSNVPSSRAQKESADVSLHDHGRAVAAVAVCIAAQSRTIKEIPRSRFRLLHGALGGIQDYVFRSTPRMGTTGGASKGIARLVRGRSFSVVLLSHLIGRRILDACELPCVQVVLEAGGRFTLLLPDTEEVVRAARRQACEVEEWLFDHFSGGPRFHWALSESFGSADLIIPKNQGTSSTQPSQQSGAQSKTGTAPFGLILRRLHELAALSKLRVPMQRLRSGAGWSESGWVGPSVGLAVDGVVSSQLAELGRRLLGAEALVVESSNGRQGDLDLVGFQIRVLSNGENDPDAVSLIAEEDATSHRPALIACTHAPSGRDLSSGRALGEDPDDLLTFEEIAAHPRDARLGPGPAMLGCLKADLDSLGQLMTSGFGSRVSLGRLGSASRTLDFFFKGFLADRLRAEFPMIYTVFAGGDDLCLIGPWCDVVQFASRMRSWLREAACDNPKISISAGIVLCKPSTPVRVMTDLAEELLERAKGSEDQGRGDHIVLLSSRLSWRQYDEALRLAEELKRAVEHEGVTTALVHRLLQLGRCAERVATTADPKLEDLRWRSQLSYDLRRNWPERQPLVALRQRLVGVTTNDGAMLAVASALALYGIRGS